MEVIAMKTNTVQAHKKANAVKPASQAETTPQKTVTVIFYGKESGKEMCRVDFQKSLITCLLSACKKMGMTRHRFFELAFEEKLKRPVRVEMVIHRTTCAKGGAR